MAKDPWHKGRIGKIKNSPAAGLLKDAAGRTAEFLGLVPPRDANEPQPNEHGPAIKQTRTEHFKAGMPNTDSPVKFSVPVEHAERDKHFEQQGLGIGTEGNVTSIRRGIALKGERVARKPEGY